MKVCLGEQHANRMTKNGENLFNVTWISSEIFNIESTSSGSVDMFFINLLVFWFTNSLTYIKM